MTDAIAFLALPAIACAALVGIHSYFGLHVLKRNVIFVDLALAQVAALGATAAFLLGHSPQSLAAHSYALGFTLAAAALLASTRAWSNRVPQEAQIGVIYVVAAAGALLLVDRAPQGAEHIRQILTGNILTVGWEELRWAIPLYVAVGVGYPFVVRTFKPGGWLAEFLFYAAFGLVVTSSVALAGVLLVFAFLIIPAAIGVLHAHVFRRQLAIAWIAGTVTAIAGLAISYWGDFSTGATLVCTYGLALALASAKFGNVAHVGRWVAVVVLVASAGWIVVSPRADQPVLDALERIFPAIRSAYMDAGSIAAAAEAEGYVARYRAETQAVRDREAERRWKGEPLEEIEVRRIASYLKSKNEMMKGEEFVMREMRNRAREVRRLWIAAAFLAFALALFLRPRRGAR